MQSKKGVSPRTFTGLNISEVSPARVGDHDEFMEPNESIQERQGNYVTP
jgi:hypothetical protein